MGLVWALTTQNRGFPARAVAKLDEDGNGEVDEVEFKALFKQSGLQVKIFEKKKLEKRVGELGTLDQPTDKQKRELDKLQNELTELKQQMEMHEAASFPQSRSDAGDKALQDWFKEICQQGCDERAGGRRERNFHSPLFRLACESPRKYRGGE
jgi:hypothetical protein